MAIPSFNLTTFRTLYPMYTAVPDAVLTNFWTAVDTVGTPIVGTLAEAKQSYYYYLIEAHFAELWQRGPGANGIVNSSTQGTVSIGFEVDKANSFIWWNQTSWGAQIVQLIKMRGGFTFIYGGPNYCDIYS